MRASTLIFAGSASLLALFVLWWAGSGTLLADFGGDNAIYFLTANHYSPYGTPHVAAAEFAAHSVYPPLYPWLLALTGGGTTLAHAHFVTALIMLGAGAAIYCAARALGCERAVAFALVLATALSRITLLEGLEIHSEHLYLALWMTAVALLASPARATHAFTVAALAIGAACLTRSFGVSLLMSFLLWLAWQRPPQAWRAALLASLPLVALNVFHHGNARYLQDLLALYREHGVVARLGANLAEVLPAWLAVFGESGQAGFMPALPMAIGLLALTGLALRLRSGCFDAWSLLAYGVLMIVWPYPAEYERMCYPLLPLALCYTVLGTRALLSRLDPRLALALPLAFVAAAIAPFVLLVQSRLAHPPGDAALAPYLRSSAWFDPDPNAAFPTLGYQRALTEGLAALGRPGRLPAGACLIAIKPAVAALYSGLRAVGYPPFAVDDEALKATLVHGPCQYLFMMMGASPSYPQYYYPYARLKDAIEVLAVFPNELMPGQPAAMLARLREAPDAMQVPNQRPPNADMR